VCKQGPGSGNIRSECVRHRAARYATAPHALTPRAPLLSLPLSPPLSPLSPLSPPSLPPLSPSLPHSLPLLLSPLLSPLTSATPCSPPSNPLSDPPLNPLPPSPQHTLSPPSNPLSTLLSTPLPPHLSTPCRYCQPQESPSLPATPLLDIHSPCYQVGRALPIPLPACSQTAAHSTFVLSLSHCAPLVPARHVAVWCTVGCAGVSLTRDRQDHVSHCIPPTGTLPFPVKKLFAPASALAVSRRTERGSTVQYSTIQ